MRWPFGEARERCTSCGRAAAPNRLLGALPAGRCLAFDPAAGLVWRICGHCDHWELIGPERAAAALPELAMRFATVPSAGPPGLAKAVVSPRLTLYRVGGAPERAARIVALIEMKAELLAGLPWWGSCLLAVWLLWSMRNLVAFLRDPLWEAVGPALLFGFGMSVATALTRRRRTGTRPSAGEWARLVLGPAGIGLCAVFGVTWPVALGAFALGALVGWKAADDQLRSRVLSWDARTGGATFREGRAAAVSGDAALEHAGNALGAFDRPPLEIVSIAAERAEGTPLMELLESVARDRGGAAGTLGLNDLPLEDRLTLRMALEMARAEPSADVHAALPVARVVAGISDRLAAPPESAALPPPAPSA